MSRPMLSEQRAIYDAGHCVRCEYFLDSADRLYPPDAGGPWCERCWNDESSAYGEES